MPFGFVLLFGVHLRFLPVCVAVVNKLINKLTPEEKASPDVVETKFKEFCVDSKKTENRFVSETFQLSRILISFSVLLFRWTGRVCYIDVE